jgi:hypothetical protein
MDQKGITLCRLKLMIFMMPTYSIEILFRITIALIMNAISSRSLQARILHTAKLMLSG